MSPLSPYFSIQYIPSGRIVRVVFAGQLDLAERLKAIRQLTEKYHHLSQLRLLVDLRYQDSTMTSAEQKQLAEAVCGNPVLQRARIAMLYRHGYSSTALASSLVARQLPGARQFLVESEALAWLRKRKVITASP